MGASTRNPGRPLGETALGIRAAMVDLRSRYERMTVRQVFYALSVLGLIDKTEGGYRQVQKQVLVMRRQGLLPWSFITDGTRWQRKPNSWDSVGDYAESVARHYRRDLWRSQDVRLEVWLEKDALADIVVSVTSRWDVPLMVSRGQSSATFLHGAGMAAQRAWEVSGASTHIYALYDYDAGGARAYETVENELPSYAPDPWIEVQRLAVTEDQILDWNLPTRPPKAKDPQAKSWGDRPCVELDAIPPDRLTALVEDAITSHIDEHAWELERRVEREERENLNLIPDLLKEAA